MADEFDVAIAGGGIGALTAAVHAARMGRSTLVLGGRAPGGLLLSIERIDGVPGFPEGVAGYELCPMLQEQAADDGAEVRMAELEGLEPAGEGWRLATSDGEVAARAVILRHRRPAEDARRRRARSACRAAASATARAATRRCMRDRTVGVVGGGDSALQEALTLADAVGEVVVLHRGDALSAQAAYREPALAHPKISVRYGTVVEEILGDDAVSGVRTRDAASGETQDLELGGLFIYVGLEPNSDYVRDLIELDADGRIPTDAAHADRARRRVRGGHRAPRLAGPGGDLRRRGRGGGQGGAPPPGRRARGAGIDTGGRGRPRQRRLTWLRSSPSTTRAAIRRRSPASRWLRACRASRARRSTSSTACSTTPRPSSTQLHAWFSEHMPGVDIKRIAAARELGRRPRDVRGDPGRRGRRRPGGGSLKHL